MYEDGGGFVSARDDGVMKLAFWGGADVLDFFRRRTMNTIPAITASTARVTPTPIPAAAPVLRPLDEGILDAAEDAIAGLLVTADEVLDEDEDFAAAVLVAVDGGLDGAEDGRVLVDGVVEDVEEVILK